MLDPASLVHDSAVDRRIYLDEDIFALEMDRIFRSNWVYVGHESEISEPGEFKTTEIGNEPVIVTRDDEGTLQVLLNRCRHRAATVCQAQHGVAKAFRCAYHGWTYDRSGSLTGVPYAPGYGTLLDRQELGLVRVPSVGSYRGFIFARLTEHGPSLLDHLGRAKEYLDAFVDASPEGEIEGRRGRHRYFYNGNWKLQLENAVDAYHAYFVHRSFFDIQDRHLGTKAQMYRDTSSAVTIDLGNGHTATDQRSAQGDAYYARFKSAPGGAEVLAELEAAYGVEGARELINGSVGGNGFNLSVFPNLVLIGVHIRTIKPSRVDKTFVELLPTTLKGLPESVNRMRLRAHEMFFGPAGFGSPDDMEIFRRVKDGLAAQDVPDLLFWRGLERERVGEDGRIVGEVTDETPQRGQYKEWLRAMTAAAQAERITVPV
jgi:phenylpropionate dioxygenase-like ring-hydroxylating dioxygenase large terminal subunit